MTWTDKFKRYNEFNYFVEFEFFTKLKDDSIVESFKKNLGVKLVPQKKLEDMNEDGWVFSEMPNPLSVLTELEEWKLERNFPKSVECYKVTTSKYSYEGIRNKIIKILNWVNDKCYLKSNLTFTFNILPSQTEYKSNVEIQNIVPMNICFNFIEDEVYKKYPDLKKSRYSRPILNQIFLKKEFISVDTDTSINISNFETPSGPNNLINFDNLGNNIFSVNLGGEEYAKNSKKMLDLTDSIIDNLISILENSLNIDENKQKLDKLLSKYKHIMDVFSNISNFKKTYKKVKLTVDLFEEDEIIKTYYHIIRPLLFQLLVHGKDNEFSINYDRELGKLQVKSLKLGKLSRFKNLQFVFCEFENCEFEDCEFYISKFENCVFNNCSFTQGNEVKNSIIEIFKSNLKNEYSNCYIHNPLGLQSGSFTKCILDKTDVSIVSFKEKCKKITFETGKNKHENKHKVTDFFEPNKMTKPKVEFVEPEDERLWTKIDKKFSKSEKEILKKIVD